jgi:hypothetical protein
MLRLMAQVLTNGGLRRRHTDTAPQLLPAPEPEPPRDDDTALLPTYPGPAAPSRLSAQSWAGELVVPAQPDGNADLDPYGRNIRRPSRRYPA